MIKSAIWLNKERIMLARRKGQYKILVSLRLCVARRCGCDRRNRRRGREEIRISVVS
jgi:hypothetical protein